MKTHKELIPEAENHTSDFENEDEDSSSSLEEDDDACELTEEVEKTFFRTLSCLKKKDPEIYNKDTRFFERNPELDETLLKEKRKKKTHEVPLTITEYEKSLLGNKELEQQNGGVWNNEGTSYKNETRKPYVQEQNELKHSFANFLKDDSDCDDESAIGGLFREPSKSTTNIEKEEEDYKAWLKGRKEELVDKSVEGDMKFLHDYWNNPDLDQDEKFLRDYILNKRFLDKDDSNSDRFGVDNTTLEEDERILNEQTQFEHKYNFRFEEPDQEFIKQYPRIMDKSLRKKDNKRKLKREAVKARKIEERGNKIKELRKLKTLKRKEIEEKLSAIKEATGNDQLGFKDEDIEKDFDPNEHDIQMQKLFDEEFYNKDESKKPFFDDDLELDQYKDEDDEGEFGCYDGVNGNSFNAYQDNYNDEDFNMDCDFTPEKAAQAKKLKLEARGKRKNKKLISATEAISSNQNAEKPVFNEKLHKTFQNYLDEYYSLDCEDFIDDLPCRFKYKQVIPNSFGLTIEEILAADDKELNRWCSMKKINEIRSNDVEKYDVKAYNYKSRNEELKRKILPSLYKSENDVKEEETPKKKKKKKKKKKQTTDMTETPQTSKDVKLNGEEIEEDKMKHKTRNGDNTIVCEEQFDIKEIKLEVGGTIKETKVANDNHKREQKIMNRKMHLERSNAFNEESKPNTYKKPKFSSRKKTKSSNEVETIYSSISDERLKAYGIKPKKFRNKLKYHNS